MVIVSKEGSILYEGERGLIYSRGISSNKGIEVGGSKPDRKICCSDYDLCDCWRDLFLCLGGSRW